MNTKTLGPFLTLKNNGRNSGQGGFSLTGAIVAMGLVAGLSVSVLQVSEKVGEGTRKIINIHDQDGLTKSIGRILDSENHCRISLAGPGAKNSPTSPVTVAKSSYDGEGEGLDVSLYASNRSGDARSALKFSGTTDQKYGKLTIKSIKMRFDAATGTHANNAINEDVGVLLVDVEKREGDKTLTVTLEFPLNITVSTDNAGQSTIYSCVSRNPSGNSSINITQGSNTLIGTSAGAAITTGSDNTLAGNSAGKSVTTGSDNTFLGKDAGKDVTTGTKNTFLGYATSGSYAGDSLDVFIGSNAGNASTADNANVFIGSSSGLSNTSGYNNVFLGKSSGKDNTTGFENTFIGNDSGKKNTAGQNNIFIGDKTGSVNTTGNSNVFTGKDSGIASTTASNNIFLGSKSGKANTTGTKNVFIGHKTGETSTSDSNNTFIGDSVGNASSGSNSSTLIGTSAGVAVTSGSGNSFAGNNAGKVVTTGSDSVFMGSAAGATLTTGTRNIFIGQGASVVANSGMATTGNDQFNLGDFLLGRTSTSAGSPPSIPLSSSSGAVINGSLTTSGSVKIGSSTAACGTSTAGAMRYDSSANAMYFCNETAWKNAVKASNSASSPLKCGSYHCCTLTSSGNVKCWGRADYGHGQLGYGSDDNAYTPVTVISSSSGTSPLANIAQIDSGSVHTCAITAGGKVKCWGQGSFGQLGDNSTANRNYSVDVVSSSSDSTPLSNISQVSTGSSQTCAVTTGGKVKCWGRNNYGQLGNNSTASTRYPVDVVASSSDSTPLSNISQVSSGTHHTCAVTTGNNIKCWGYGNSGRLGNNSTSNKYYPVDVVTSSSDSTPLASISQVSAGGSHTCAVTTGGNVKCWGYGNSGQLGNNSTSNKYYPVDVVTSSSDSTPLASISQVSAGSYHTCAVTTGGNVKCWGYNVYGQLGNNSNSNKRYPVDVVTSSSDSTPLTNISKISSALYHTCAVTTGGKIKCWGYNNAGQLGNNSTGNRKIPVALRPTIP